MDFKTEALRAFLAQTAASGSMDEIVEAAPGVAESAGEAGAAGSPERRILEKIARGEALSAGEQFHTEAIIIPDRRPAIDIVDGSCQVSHADWLHLNEAAIRTRLESVMPSIGRIEVPGHPWAPYGGTGFMVGPGLVMTNRHVAELFAAGLGQANLHFIPGRSAGMDFLRERGASAHEPIAVTGLSMIHPYWDMALLRIDGLPQGHAPLALETEAIEEFAGRDVAVIGYPAFDPRNPATVQDQVFGGLYGIKRLQPGKIRGRFAVKSYDRMVEAPTHDASTLGGNSGSCVIDVATGRVLALHFGGRYLKANYAVAACDLARDRRVVDAGVGFADAPPAGPVPWDGFWRDTERAAPAPSGPAVSATAATATAAAGMARPADGAAASGEIRLSVPLEISIRLGQPGAAGAPAQVVEAPRKPYHDPDYSTRTGYDPEFLGLTAALPRPRNPGDLLPIPGSGHLLHYHHFSLAMHRTRRLAAMTAANVDASEAAKTPGNLPASAYTRAGLSGLSSDAWMFDPRIESAQQLAERFFDKDRQSFDKGHVVRRDDAAWGADYEEMRFANGDTFHVTNCAPQISAFNRSHLGSDNWGDLENLVLDQAETEKLSVFGGPVLADDDPLFAGVDDAGPVSIRIPRRYWKLIVARKQDALEAFGFVLEQDLSAVDMEFAVPARWTRFMEPVSAIEALSGFDFSDAIRAADRFDNAESLAMFEAAGIPLRMAASATPALAGLGEVLEFWRAEQARGGAAEGPDTRPDTRFVIELAAPLTNETIRAELASALGLDLEVANLFDPDRDLDRFRRVDLPGIRQADRADLFDVARAIGGLLDAVSVEPDLDTRHFDPEPFLAPEGTAESADYAAWCWAGDADRPDDPDWALKRANLPEAWARSEADGRPPRGRGIAVFQPDTGVTGHPELPPGTEDDPRAANFVEPGTPPVDPLDGGGNPGHGTGTGSVVASPEGGSIRGAAPEAELVPLRCLRSVAVFNQSRIAQAVNHARNNGAHVITMSLGGVPSLSLRAAIHKAVRANIIVLAAAGNCVGTVVWPARYDEVIAVAGTNAADRPWRGSSRGRSVDISGPAEFVLRADPRNPATPDKVAGGQGTSFAVAMTAGVAACWLAHHGRDALIAGLSPGQTLQDRFRAMLRRTARVPAGYDTDDFGAGIIDADALLAADPLASGAEEAAFAPGEADLEAQIRALFAESAGTGQAEAAATAARDPASLLELACVGLDMARYRSSRHRSLEALPPAGLSRGLKASAGAAVAAELMRADAR